MSGIIVSEEKALISNEKSIGGTDRRLRSSRTANIYPTLPKLIST